MLGDSRFAGPEISRFAIEIGSFENRESGTGYGNAKPVGVGQYVRRGQIPVMRSHSGRLSALPGSKLACQAGSCSITKMPQPTRNIGRLSVIVGSARTDGNTAAIVSRFVQRLPSPPVVVNLTGLKIEPFEYGCHERQDDFQFVVGSILASDHVIFATPVYWYAMAGPMKSFFDRLTDLLVVPNGRRIGRALAGRSVWLLSTGTDETLPLGFEEPFARTAKYFDMIWCEAFYCRSIKGAPPTDEALSEVDRLAELMTS